VQLLLAVKSRLVKPNHLMLESFKIDNHALHPPRRCDVEMGAVSAEASVTVTMNVCPKWIRLEELP